MAVSRYIVMGCVFTYLVASEFHSESVTSDALKLNLELRKKKHRKAPVSKVVPTGAIFLGQRTEKMLEVMKNEYEKLKE